MRSGPVGGGRWAGSGMGTPGIHVSDMRDGWTTDDKPRGGATQFLRRHVLSRLPTVVPGSEGIEYAPRAQDTETIVGEVQQVTM